MVKFIKKQSFMHEVVAVSLQMLVNQNKRMSKPSIDMGEEKAYISEDAKPELEGGFHYSKKTSTKNMKALSSSSVELLQTLVDVFTVSGTDISSDFKVHQKFPSYYLHFILTNRFKVFHCLLARRRNQEKEDKIASLQTEVSSLKKKESSDSSKQLGKAQARALELEKQES